MTGILIGFIIFFVAGILILYFSLDAPKKQSRGSDSLSKNSNTSGKIAVMSAEEKKELLDNTRDMVRHHSKEAASVIRKWMRGDKN